jgi:O-antigen ligase
MAGVVLAVNSVLVLASLVGNPAPQSVGPWEMLLVGTVAATVGLLLVTGVTGLLAVRYRHQFVPLLLIPAFALPLLVSIVVGVAAGVPMGAALRATAPYVLFLPVLMLGLIAPRPAPGLTTIPLCIAGLLQSLYLLGLFLVAVPDSSNAERVWILRTTLIEPRTTLPFLLAAATLPLAWRDRVTTGWSRILGPASAGLAAAAALSTQTRSQVLAVLAGIASYFVLSVTLRLRRQGRPWVVVGSRVALGLLGGLVIMAALGVAIPQTRALMQAVAMRSQSELDTGRFRDEWEPAVDAVLERGLPGLTFGIGAGESFITAGGEERTYIHNLVLYSLVYFGTPGLGLMLLSYILLFLALVRRSYSEDDPRYLGLAAMLAGMFVFAQFFAVHKLFSYNIMLVLAAQTLAQPARKRGLS